MPQNTKVILVTITLITLAACGGLWFVLSGLHAEANNLAAVIETITNEQAVEQDQQALSTLLDATAADRDLLSSYIIDGEAGTIRFLSTVDDYASAAGLELTTKELTVIPKVREPYQGLSVTYEVRGGEEAVKQFIKMLETIPYASEITQLSLARGTGEEGVYWQAGVALLLSITNL